MKRYQIDRKRRRKLLEKKQAQGHHREDQEPAQGILLTKEDGMGEFVYFTEEQKQRANAVDLEDFLSRQGEKLLRSGEKSAWPVITVLQ